MKLSRAPRKGDIRIKKRFAFWPIEGTSGERRWLEMFRIRQEYYISQGSGVWWTQAILCKGEDYIDGKIVNASTLEKRLFEEKFNKGAS